MRLSQSVDIQFTNTQGHVLAGVLHRPSSGEPKAYVLYAACFTCSKDIPIAARLARALAQRGYGVLRFDLMGLGESEGDFAVSDFETEIEDILAAARWLREHYSAPALLVGHSLGGAALLEAAAKLPEASSIATIGSPATLEHVRTLIERAVDRHLPDGALVASIGGHRFTFPPRFFEVLERYDPTAAAMRLKKAYLILHAPDDAVVPYEHARALFSASHAPHAFVRLDGADHLLRRQTDVNYCAEVISTWTQSVGHSLIDSRFV